MKHLAITLIVAAVLLNGCAVKQSDSLAVKALKHTVNLPAYGGAAVELAIQGTLIGVGYAAKKTKEGLESLSDQNTTKNM